MPAPEKPEFLIYQGVTVADMPGKDVLTRRMNFSLFRRGKLPGYDSCQGLRGEALKGEFARLNAGQRTKSLMARDMRVAALAAAAERHRATLPPADPACAPLRGNPGGGGDGVVRGGRGSERTERTERTDRTDRTERTDRTVRGAG